MTAAAVIGLALAALVAGCGASKPDPLPPACSDGPDKISSALVKAPGDVRLDDGTLLSACIAQASDDAELQQVGYTFTPVADRLAASDDERSATQLGFLVGAVRRGAKRTNGVQAELLRRMESRVRYDDPVLLRAAERGATAGEEHG